MLSDADTTPAVSAMGIQFSQPYEVSEQSARPVSYVDRFELEREIVRRREDEDSDDWEDEAMPKKMPFRPPLRTD